MNEPVEEEKWIVDEKSQRGKYILELKRGFGFRAGVRFDGCVHLHMDSMDWNTGEPDREDSDYMHICDLDDFIKALQELRESAREHFKNDDYGVWK